MRILANFASFRIFANFRFLRIFANFEILRIFAKFLKIFLEMNDEDDEFVDLFDDLCYIDGGNQSGFYLVEEQVFETR